MNEWCSIMVNTVSKMFIRSKPVRFEYTIWCLCGENGYPYQLIAFTLVKTTTVLKMTMTLKMTMLLRPRVGGGGIPHLPSDTWFDGVGRFKSPVAQGRCKVRQKNKKKNTHYICHKCNVRILSFTLMFIFLKDIKLEVKCVKKKKKHSLHLP